jgi:hypothetical protein
MIGTVDRGPPTRRAALRLGVSVVAAIAGCHGGAQRPLSVAALFAGSIDDGGFRLRRTEPCTGPLRCCRQLLPGGAADLGAAGRGLAGPASFRAVNSWRHLLECGVIDRWREAVK